jgi:tetratricopeptide (TPR) repeat protein
VNNNTVVQQYLEQYHQLASEIRDSSDLDQAVLALESLFNVELTDQIVFLKVLAQESSSDAADVAQAINNIAPEKEVRKEARRALLRLESQDIYPQWKVTPSGAILPIAIESKPELLPTRGRPALTDDMPPSFDAIFQEIEDFFGNLPTAPYIEPVSTLLESFGEGDFEDAYNALASDSPLRAGLDLETWVARRTQWLEAARTDLVKVTYIGEKETLAPDRVVVEATWSLPIGDPTIENPPAELPAATCVLKETGRHWFWTSYVVVEEDGEWHITDMTDEGVVASQLPSEEIQSILESKAEKASQRLAELEAEVDDEEETEDLDEDDEEVDDDDDDDEEFEDEEDEEDLDFLEEMDEVIREATQSMHYYDALIQKGPNDDPGMYESAAQFAQIIQDTERAAVYFQQMAQNVPEYRGKALRNLAIMYEQILQDYLADDPEDPEPEKQRYNKLIEETFRQSIEADQTPLGYILLADMLIRQHKNLDEAETFLKKAQLSATEDEEIVSIEAGLAQIAQSNGQKEEALQHYQKVVQLDTDFPHIWFQIGSLQRQLNNFGEAIVNLRRSVKQDPDLVEANIELSVIYSDQKQFNKARDILRKALEEFPDSADLLASLSIVYTKSGDIQSAQRYLQQAEIRDELNSFVAIARAMLQAQKEQKLSASRSTSKDRNQSKHHSHKNKKK